LHELVVDLRAWFDGCHEDVVWTSSAANRALDRKKALAILDWLAERPRVRKAAK